MLSYENKPVAKAIIYALGGDAFLEIADIETCTASRDGVFFIIGVPCDDDMDHVCIHQERNGSFTLACGDAANRDGVVLAAMVRRKGLSLDKLREALVDATGILMPLLPPRGGIN